MLQKITRRLRDVPWRALEVKDRFLPTPFARLYEQVQPYTLCGNARLRGLYRAIHRVERERIEGDVVECGTARGGSAALMGLTLNELGSPRRLWVFDTFEGLPPPSQNDPDYHIAQSYVGECRGDLQDVQGLFTRLGLMQRAHLVKGLFQDTLHKTPLGSIAVLHLDGDWYDSVMTCLVQLYDKVSVGGVIQIDDYGHWQGAEKAVHDFFGQRGIPLKLHYLDYTGRYIIKPATPRG